MPVDKVYAKRPIDELYATQVEFIGKMNRLKERLEYVINNIPNKYKTSEYADKIQDLKKIKKIIEDLINVGKMDSITQTSIEKKLGKAADYLLGEKFNKFTSLLLDYLSLHEDTLSFLNTLQADKSANLYTKINPEGQDNIQSMFIRPIQRIARYHLLVDGISKHEKMPSGLVSAYQEALEISRKAALAVNERQRFDEKLKPFKDAITNMKITSIIELKNKKFPSEKWKARTEARIKAFGEALRQLRNQSETNLDIGTIIRQLKQNPVITKVRHGSSLEGKRKESKFAIQIDSLLKSAEKISSISSAPVKAELKSVEKTPNYEEMMDKYETTAQRINDQLGYYAANKNKLTLEQVESLRIWLAQTIQSSYAREYLKLNENTPIAERFSLMFQDVASRLPKQQEGLKHLARLYDIKIMDKSEIAANRINKQLDDYEKAIKKFNGLGQDGYAAFADWLAQTMQSTVAQDYFRQHTEVTAHFLTVTHQVKEHVSPEKRKGLEVLEARMMAAGKEWKSTAALNSSQATLFAKHRAAPTKEEPLPALSRNSTKR